jgi:acyl carrier protein
MADLDKLERQVVDIIAQKKRLPPENITLDSTFLDLGIDSLDGMDLLFAFEDTFNISIPDDIAQQMKTVRMVTEGLRRVLGNRAVAST